jgi:iron complex transport system substrate-binding protein
MLFALGLDGRIVGDTTFCNYPPAALKVAKIGDVNTNIEKVIALRPDLIVATDANRSATLRLTQLHLSVFVIAPTSLSATEQSLRLLGQITEAVGPAQRVVAQMEAKQHRAEAIAAHDARHHPRVLVVVVLNPLWTAGTGTFIDDVLNRAGGVNVAASVHLYAPFSKEVLLTHPPDMILAGAGEAAAMRTDPVFRHLTAVQSDRFFSVNADILTRPGPRLADALLQVAQALHPGVK